MFYVLRKVEIMDGEGYSLKHISESIGLKSRAIKFYTEQGVVSPGISAGSGRGTSRKYSKSNIVAFGIIKSLAAYGMTIGKIKNIMEESFDEMRGGEHLISYYIENWDKENEYDYFLII